MRSEIIYYINYQFIMKNILILISIILGYFFSFGQNNHDVINNTSIVPATIPYFCDFENTTENSQWESSNSTCVNKWYIGAPYNITEPLSVRRLYISNDNGVSIDYNQMSSSTAVAYRRIVSSGALYYNITFDLYIGGETDQDFLKLYILDEDTNYVGSTSNNPPYYGVNSFGLNEYLYNYNHSAPFINGYDGFTGYYDYPVYKRVAVQIPSMGAAGTIKKLTFVWRNNSNMGNFPAAVIDHISITESSCAVPGNLSASNIGTNSIDLSWTENGTSNFWYIAYKKTNDTGWTTLSTQTNPHHLTGLSNSTYYDIKVKAYNGEESLYSYSIKVRTLCGELTQYPWESGFEEHWDTIGLLPGNEVAPDCWINLNSGDDISYWQKNSGIASSYSGFNAVKHISSSTTTQHHDYLITPIFHLTGNERLKFWIKGNSYNNNYIKVGIYNISQNGHDFNSADDTTFITTILPNTIASIDQWIEKTILLNNYTGDFRIVFIKDQIGGSTLTLDKISIETIPACSEPISSNVILGSTSATIQWVPYSVSDTAFYLYFKSIFAGIFDSVIVNGNQYTLNNLYPNRLYDYYIRTICGTDYSASTFPLSFTTLCEYIDTLPFVENFDTYGTTGNPFPTCWLKNSVDASFPSISSTNYSYPGALCFSDEQFNGYNYAITPKFNSSIVMNQLKASFLIKAANYTDTLFYGLMEDPYDITTFVSLGFCTVSQISSFEYHEIFFDAYTGNGHFIAFKTRYSGHTSHIYLDNLSIDYSPVCANPISVVVSDVSENQAIVDWVENGSAVHWNIEYGYTGFAHGTGAVINNVANHPLTITGLSPQTEYQIYIQSNCGTDLSPWSFPMIFRTECVPLSTIPWTEYFDSYGTSTNLNTTCWRKLSSNPTYPMLSTFGSSGNKVLLMSNSSLDSYCYAILPRFDLMTPVNSLKLDFDMYASDYNDTLFVGVMSDAEDTSSFELVATYTVSNTSNWENIETFFGSYNGNAPYIAFKTKYSSSDTYIWVDNLIVSYQGDCPEPSNITISNISSTSVTLNWIENGDATSWNLEYGPTGFSPGSGIFVGGITNTFYQINNLIPQTGYSLYIQSICGDSTSVWSNTYSFMTTCADISQFPWSDNFDSYSTAYGSFPYCWKKLSNVSYYPTIQSINYSPNGSLRMYCQNVGNYNYVITPKIHDTIPINMLSILFKMRSQHISDSLLVGIMTDPTDTNTFQLIQKVGLYQTGIWLDKYISFADYQGVGKYIAIKFINQNGNLHNIFIDNFTIDYIPSCPYPIDLHAISTTTSTITIGWNEVGNTLTWNMEYGPVGFLLGSGTQIQGLYTNPFTVTGLQPQTAYQFYIQSNCGAEYSLWSTPITVFTSCGSISQLPWTDGFDYYTMNNQTLPSCWSFITNSLQSIWLSNYNFSPPASLYFQNLDSTSFHYIITPPLSSTISMNDLRIEFKMKTQIIDTLYIGVMNSNTDTNSFVLVKKIVTSNSNGFTDQYVDFDTYTGNGEFIALKTKSKNIYSTYYIDNFKITTNPHCNIPGGLSVTNVTSNSAIVHWSETGTAYSWVLEYGESGFVPGTGVIINGVTDTSYLIQNLNPETSYQFYVKSYCSYNNISNYSLPFSFTTLCLPINSLPFVENFDLYGYNNGIIPPCFKKLSSYSANSYPQISSITNYSAPNAFLFNCNLSGAYNVLILPEVDSIYPINNIMVSFQLNVYGNDDTLYVGIMNNMEDPDDIEIIKKITVSSTSTWKYFYVYFNDYQGTGKHIAFKTKYGATNSLVYMDNLVIDTMPDCPIPSNVTALNITQNSIDIDFTEEGTSSLWEVEYGPSGFNLGTGSVLTNITTHPITINGLSAQTAYQFYVKSICSATEQSEWSDPITVAPACTVITQLPWSELFDQYGTGTQTFPMCWTKNTNSTSYPLISINGYSPPGSLFFFTSFSGGYNLAATPLFDSIIKMDSLLVQFKYKTINPWDSIQIGVMSNPLDTGTFILMFKIGAPITGEWFDKELYFNNYTGTGHYIAFKLQYQNNMSRFNIDNLYIDYLPSCLKPSQPTLSNLTATSVDLSWIENGSATQWKIEYGLAGYSPGSGNSIIIDSTNYQLTGLLPGTCYDIYLKAICNSSDESGWSEKKFFCTPQIPLHLPVSFDFESLSGFQFSNNASGNKWCIGSATNNTVNGTNSLYISNDDGTNNQYSFNLQSTVWAYKDIYFNPSTTDYTLTMDWKCNGENIGTTKRDYFNIYIGNLDTPVPSSNNVINIPSGAIQVGPLLNGNPSWETINITIPNSYCSGYVKRVFFCWINDNSAGNQPPAALDNMYLTSDGIILCLPPDSVSITNITTNTVTVSWNPGGDETLWQVDYKKVNSETWEPPVTANNPYIILTGLDLNNEYIVKVKSLCPPAESEYSIPIQFTTLEHNVYTINASSSIGGTITPSGSILVEEGNNQQFTLTPDENAVIFSLLVDDELITDIQPQYTFYNVIDNHTIRVEYMLPVKENSSLDLLTITPNPAHELININIISIQYLPIHLNLFTIHGKCIQTYILESPNELIDISNLVNGVYILQFEIDHQFFNYKIIKQ